MPKNESIFPEIEKTSGNYGETYFAVLRGGLTKREIFAAMAMQSIIGPNNFATINDICDHAVEYADGLIKALGK